MKSLQSKIFFLFVILLLLVQAVSLWTVYSATEQHELQQVEHQLGNAKKVFQTEFKNRNYYLAAFAETVAKDFGLKQVFQEDTRSFLVALNNHRKRIDADLAIAISVDGLITAQLVKLLDDNGEYRVRVGPEQAHPFRFTSWLELSENAHLYPLENNFFQFNLAPLKSGSVIIGWVGFGFHINQQLAERFTDLTGLKTDFAMGVGGQWQLIATAESNLTPQQILEETQLVNKIMDDDQAFQVIAAKHRLGTVEKQDLVMVMYGVRDDFLAAIRQRWKELLFLALLMLGISLVGALVIAKNISQSIKILVKQTRYIASGNYDQSVSVGGGEELEQLAYEINQMQLAVVSRERTISHQAYHDPLTDLPNRNRLILELDEWIAGGCRSACLFRLRVRRVKDVNDSFGQEFGDKVVSEAGKRLAQVAQSDRLFHLGGSEFVLLYEDVSESNIKLRLDAIEQIMEPIYKNQSVALHIELQVGVSLYPQHDRISSGLLQKAGTALRMVQSDGEQHFMYNASLSSATVDRFRLINELKTAIEQDQLTLHYQPKLSLADNHIGQVEALVRWQHPERGLISPDKFIMIAEQTGQINALTRWVLNCAAKQCQDWLKQGISLNIAVNISAENLKDNNFYPLVMDTLRLHQLGRNAISLEVTESAVVEDPESAIALLTRFEQQGIGLSIDDYGTGYSSLAQLKRLPVSELKIDKAFIQKLLLDKIDEVIVSSTLELAHKMNLTVVAEGVEDEATLQWLKANACQVAQGYFICRPKPADELIEWLVNSAYFGSDKAAKA